MPKTRRPTAYVTALLVAMASMGAVAPPASAAKVDARTASDDELSNASRSLVRRVNAQIARVNAAKRASARAKSDYATATAELESTERRITRIEGAVVDYAVHAYMRPQGRGVGFDGRDLVTESRQRALWQHVEHRQDDVLDELRAARQDQERREAVARRARDRAVQRRRDEAAQLKVLSRDVKARDQLSTAIDSRIRAAESEDDATLANEVTIQAAIASAGDPGVKSKAGLIWPVKGRVTSGFGQRWGRLHAGLDIAAPGGTPIKAARAGKVVFSGSMGGYGNAVIINHGDDMATLYAHQSRRAATVGEIVKQGEVIGYVGSTGHSTGNHLHFETRINGKARNPRPYLP